MLDTVIVGGGLCGLALATSLQTQGVDFALLEARKRLGGRVLSIRCETARMSLDLGPAWFWPETQKRITRLVNDLDLKTFGQWSDGQLTLQCDANAQPERRPDSDVYRGAHRVEGGMGAIIEAISQRIPADRIHLGHVLKAVVDQGDHVDLHVTHGDEQHVISCRRVVLALPPRLVEERVRFSPNLPQSLSEVLRDTPTWMAGHAKVVIGYEEAFWRKQGLSGSALASHPQAVVGETFDSCNANARRAALGGFIALPAALRDSFQEGLPMLIRSQMVQLFGPEAQRGEKHFKDWAQEAYTCSTLDRAPLTAHPNYGHPLLRQPWWQGRLHLGGSETASYGGGYLEGALEAAGRLRDSLLDETTPHAAVA